ncbi:MAG TPA: glycosyltransferase family 2 protein [Clostridia bacterium]|nr:glycosyltransferase family 2 protein [Clostridia bacterium]
MQVSAIIPAFNEEKTVAGVIRPLMQVPAIGEIIVVNDGSTDNTEAVAREAGATVISSPCNRGKGGAMMLGVEHATHEVLLFLDADLIGLTPAHVEQLIEPVLSGRVEMAVGVFEHGRLATDLAQMVAPFLSGQRAVTKSLLRRIDNLEWTRFGVEMALTKYAAEHDVKLEEVVLEDLSHVMKEEKLGLWKGLRARVKMYWEIAKSLSDD